MTTTETLARELEQILDSREMLKWDDFPKFLKDDWLRVATHVQEREKVLREALEKYGQHFHNCPCLCYHEETLPCTCGFATAKELLK